MHNSIWGIKRDAECRAVAGSRPVSGAWWQLVPWLCVRHHNRVLGGTPGQSPKERSHLTSGHNFIRRKSAPPSPSRYSSFEQPVDRLRKIPTARYVGKGCRRSTGLSLQAPEEGRHFSSCHIPSRRERVGARAGSDALVKEPVDWFGKVGGAGYVCERVAR